jgi:uncharacterized protein
MDGMNEILSVRAETCDIHHRFTNRHLDIKGGSDDLGFSYGVATFGVTMKFEWDEGKNRANRRKHGLDFEDAEELFRGVVAAEPDTREDCGEKRWVGLGLIHGRIMHVVFAEREPDTIRIISLRKATKRENEQYEKAIQDRLEES